MTITHFNIIENKTGKVVGKAKTREGARRAVDKRDNAYGAYAYHYAPVYVNPDDNLTFIPGVSY